MNFKLVFYILGKVMVFLSFFMLLPSVVALINSESAGIYFVVVAMITFILGSILSWKKPDNTGFYAREGWNSVKQGCA